MLAAPLEVALCQPGICARTFADGRDGGLEMHGLADPHSGSWARILPDDDNRVRVTEGGPHALWDTRADLTAQWVRAGRPDHGAHGLTVTPGGGHTLWRDQPEHTAWPFPPPRAGRHGV
ncbi:hypothetical protein [Streptomyces sp. NPDC001985]|uniref:hypothetical protein n=1 Tax=Streptomyces sp. NPDC001985 TaxID=3154406 RepID=UPI0033165348